MPGRGCPQTNGGSHSCNTQADQGIYDIFLDVGIVIRLEDHDHEPFFPCHFSNHRNDSGKEMMLQIRYDERYDFRFSVPEVLG